MFLIRTAFWLAVVVMLLPTDEKKQAQLKAAAWDAAYRAATFCDRNGETCAQAGQIWVSFKQKLEFGARLTSDLASEYVFKATRRHRPRRWRRAPVLSIPIRAARSCRPT
ncbi:MAG TPA: hypothetical protein PK264_04950 [Hyphomicrobiaceae bacterium]|nr:hypothetical protein [Hyphomicrobiaceae bacterium]